MQRKVFVSGIAALLVALLAGCTGGSSDGGSTDDSNPGDTGTATAAAQPGKYRTLPEPCGAVGEDTLDTLLPGIQQITDAEQREKAYEGDATLTYDTDRKVGCRWKVESADATDHLLVDFERVVSYDNSVSDDNEAQEVFADRLTAADLPEPVSSSPTSSPDVRRPAPAPLPRAAPAPAPRPPPPTLSLPRVPPPPPPAPSDLQPRILTDLGDEAFLDDVLSGSGSTAQQRTVTVAFRTSNVIVTIEYEEQPATVGVAPDSEEMQDRARKLAAQLSDTLGGQ